MSASNPKHPATCGCSQCEHGAWIASLCKNCGHNGHEGECPFCKCVKVAGAPAPEKAEL